MNASLVFTGFILTFLLVVTSPLSAQERAEQGLLKQQPVHSTVPHFHLQAGSVFGGAMSGGTFFAQSLAPSINWDISRRFSLQAGTIFSTTQMNGMNPLFPYTPHMAGGESASVLGNQRMFSTTFFAFGAYQVSPRLTLTGGTWMERGTIGEAEMRMNAQAFDTNPRGMVFGFDYRVTDNFSLGAEVNVSRGYNPFNPLYNRGFYGSSFGGVRSPFASPSPFHRNPRW